MNITKTLLNKMSVAALRKNAVSGITLVDKLKPYAYISFSQNSNISEDSLIDLVLKARNQDRGDSAHVADAKKVVDDFLGSVTPVTPPEPSPAMSTLYRAPQQVDNYVAQYPELKVLQQPTAKWISKDWTNYDELKQICTDAKSKSQTPIIAFYDMQNRDNGGASGGGAQSHDDYISRVKLALAALTTSTIVILEPDSLALGINTSYLVEAGKMFKQAGHQVYIDCAHPGWLSAGDAYNKLRTVSIELFDGFSVNVSNYQTTADCEKYRDDILSKLTAANITGKKGLIDTSRNGNGPKGSEWENPSGRKIGFVPDIAKLYIWAKAPGESDGPNNTGGQQWGPAGEFDVKLAQNLISGNW